MEQRIFTLFARTPIHVGAGNSVGAIDSPITRERHTRIPIIPGSALKGVLADMWPPVPTKKRNSKETGAGEEQQQKTPEQVERELIFGREDNAGALLVGEARVLAFPLRSARGAFAWITCPLALQRFVRDSGKEQLEQYIPVLKNDTSNEMFCVSGADILTGGKVILEEYVFTADQNQSEKLTKIEEEFKSLADDPVWPLMKGHLAVISNEMFSYFVENACEVVTRIRIDDVTGTVKGSALFNQEQIPSETLLYSVLGWQQEKESKWNALCGRLAGNGNQLQVGGDETIGLGCCSVKLI